MKNSTFFRTLHLRNLVTLPLIRVFNIFHCWNEGGYLTLPLFLFSRKFKLCLFNWTLASSLVKKGCQFFIPGKNTFIPGKHFFIPGKIHPRKKYFHPRKTFFHPRKMSSPEKVFSALVKVHSSPENVWYPRNKFIPGFFLFAPINKKIKYVKRFFYLILFVC